MDENGFSPSKLSAKLSRITNVTKEESHLVGLMKKTVTKKTHITGLESVGKIFPLLT